MFHSQRSKDDNNFREALRLYENKQYKKTIKLLDTIIKRNPAHNESVALKGLALYYSELPEKKDAEQYILRASEKGSQDPVVCHITGLYYRASKKYAEAAKWYQSAMDNNSTNMGILRDLSSCLSQTRDYKHLVKARIGYLDDQPGYRANWTAAAVAHYLNGSYKNCETVLSKIQDLVKGNLTDADMFENSECLLFKNRAIAATGDYQRALDDLDAITETGDVYDGVKLLEYRAEYLEKLGRPQEASLAFRKLLKRNPENFQYYYDLERTLGTTDLPARTRLALYEKLAKFYPRSDPVRFIPLTFLTGELFEKKAKEYLVSQLSRGVPATFVNVKPLYRRKLNRPVLLKIALEFYEANDDKDPMNHTWAGYFLAQHFYRCGDYEQAMRYIDEAIAVTPTLVELYIVKARILKRTNKLREAAETMEKARNLDLQDRFINSKAIKYFLRDNQIRKAVDVASLFTRNEDAPNGVQDLHLMQCTWFLTESAEAYFRLYKLALKKWQSTGSDDDKKDVELNLGLALKRYQAVIKVFGEYSDDQFDFHHYSMRKGTPTTYLSMMSWEDGLYHEPLFLRSAVGITRLYLEVLGNQAKVQELLQPRKSHKESKQQQEELVNYSRDYAKDDDVFGEKVIRSLCGLERKEQSYGSDKLFELAQKADCDQSFNAEYVVFRANQYLQKYVLSLSALRKTRALDAHHHNIGYMYLELQQDKQGENTPTAVKKILDMGLNREFEELTAVEGDALNEKLVNEYFTEESLESGISVLESQLLQPSALFEKRLQQIESALDPYSGNYLEYYKVRL